MTRTDIFEKLNNLFAEVLDLETVKLKETTTASDVEGWDSLAHITLMSEVEDLFGVKFSMKTILTLKNVGELVDAIEEAL